MSFWVHLKFCTSLSVIRSFIVLIVSKTLKNNLFARYYFITIGSVLLVGLLAQFTNDFFLIICILVSPFLKVIILKILSKCPFFFFV